MNAAIIKDRRDESVIAIIRDWNRLNKILETYGMVRVSITGDIDGIELGGPRLIDY